MVVDDHFHFRILHKLGDFPSDQSSQTTAVAAEALTAYVASFALISIRKGTATLEMLKILDL